jgi:hypothetical protein
LAFAGGNPGIIKAEIFNLIEQKKGVDFNVDNFQENLTKLYYKRAGLITNLNIVLAQTKERNLPDGIKNSLNEKASFIQNDLANVQYQIDTIQERVRSSKSSEYSINNQISVRKKVLNNIIGNIVAKRQAESSSSTNKELSRVKG